MIEFQDALKKSRAYNLIKHDIDTGNLSHAYMVISPDVFAVKNLFRLIACAVYCKDACTTCPVCKKVLNGNHADVKFINEDGKKSRSKTSPPLSKTPRRNRLRATTNCTL